MRRLLFLPALAFLPRLLAAQGITTASIQGIVTQQDGAPIADATVRLINLADGRRWEVATRSNGRYVLEGVAVGGPYRLEVQAAGFAPREQTGIAFVLGQRLVADFTLSSVAVTLAPVTVEATADPVLNRGRTGPSEIISAERIATLPNLGRDFLTLTMLSPQVAISPSSRRALSGGVTLSGQSRLFNDFQIDGGLNSDPYTGRLPGRETLPRPISLEALQEIQVLVAPFDVRYGDFSGGLVNAVTRSGSNVVHGSMFGFWSDGVFVGKNAAGKSAAGFTTLQYGAAVGGPIVRDRVHYFFSLDVQHRVVPDPGPLITDTAGGADLINVGIRYASAKRFQDILRDTFRLEPGTLGPLNGAAPATDVFGKVTVQLGRNSHLELSHHYTDGDRRDFIDRGSGVYALSSQGQREPATVNASRIIWTSVLGGRWSSELVGSYLQLHDACRPDVSFPLLRITNVEGGILLAGTRQVCRTSFGQSVFDVTENLTAAFGPHVFTLGGHAGQLHSVDDQILTVAGLWNFDTLDSLAVGRAAHYERGLPGPAGSGVTFDVHQVGLYAQDRWNPTRALTLTAGVRIDVPILPDAAGAGGLVRTTLGVETGRLPSGSLVWSPRLGFNYDVGGQERSFLRGGIGLFTGQPPYAWVGSAYQDDGAHHLLLSCDRGNVPAFDPINQPVICTDGRGAIPQLTFIGPNVRFPQSVKAAFGVDQRLPAAVIGSIDVLYTRVVHQWYYSDANLGGAVGVARGEGGRLLYGTITGTTNSVSVTPARPASTLGPMVRVSDRSGDRSFTLSIQLRKRFGDGVETSAFYGYTRARDRMSLVNLEGALMNLQNAPLEGGLENRRLGISYFEIPHRLEVSALVRLPHRARLSLLYAGASGTPFTYTITGDANADGIGGGSAVTDDIVYVPRDSLDIELKDPGRWGALDKYIESEPCLRRQRGHILARNSCREPWFGTLDARLTQSLPTVPGQFFELTMDVYNVLNLVNRRWGQSRVTAINPPTQPILRLTGYDTNAGRGIYDLSLPGLRQIQDLPSRWQMELSVRYVF